ncbi:MAG: hypothetical protein HC880_15385 [Bacteroidia bacterium]|nr:hypothetical protein [Bacteroidia bacterium]
MTTLKNKNKNEWEIKYKVILGFSLGIAALFLVGFLIFQSINKLLRAVDSLSEPNRELALLNGILVDLSGLETNNRAYSINSDEKFLTNIIQTTKRVRHKLLSLRNHASLPEDQQRQVDSIYTLLSAFPQNIKDFLDLKAELQETNFSAKAQNIIALRMKAFGSMRGDSVLLMTDTLEEITVKEIKKVEQAYQDYVRRDFEEQEKEKKSWLKRIFSKKKEEKEKKFDTIQRKPEITELTTTKFEITIDSAVVLRPDTVMRSINRTLGKLKQEEKDLHERINEKEMALIQYNASIIHHIKDILNRLEKEAQREARLSLENANEVAYSTIIIISLIVGVCVLSAIVLLYLISADITKSNFYKKQLLAAKKEAEELAQAKEAFLANMSHEIRTPLHAILGFSEQMLKEKSGLLPKEAAGAIHSSSKHLLALVNDILDLSKIEARQLKLEEVDFSLYELFHNVQQTFQIEARAKNIYLETHLPPEADLILHGDVFRFRQILFNLVSNAIKFTEKAEWISG